MVKTWPTFSKQKNKSIKLIFWKMSVPFAFQLKLLDFSLMVSNPKEYMYMYM